MGFNATLAKPFVLLHEDGSDAFLQTCCNIRGQRSDAASLRFLKQNQRVAGAAPLGERARDEKEKERIFIRQMTPLTAEVPKFPPVICLHVPTNELDAQNFCPILRGEGCLCQNHNEEAADSSQIDSKQTFRTLRFCKGETKMIILERHYLTHAR